MPIYEYRCPSCGNEQENLIKAASDAPCCEACGKDGLQRKLSVFAVSAASPGAHDCACAEGNPASRGGGCPHAGGCGCSH